MEDSIAGFLQLFSERQSLDAYSVALYEIHSIEKPQRSDRLLRTGQAGGQGGSDFFPCTFLIQPREALPDSNRVA